MLSPQGQGQGQALCTDPRTASHHRSSGQTRDSPAYAARKLGFQQRLLSEVDAFWGFLAAEGREGRDPTFEDLARMPFLAACFRETLRLFPAVAAGTYRVLQFDEQVSGAGGESVTLKAGTHVQIPNWARHRSPELWGADAEEFNPDRHFTATEESPGWNPASPRFTPFASAPRGCLGLNFAQLEGRLILACLLREYTFRSHEKWTSAGLPDEQLVVDYGTMGPRDLTQPDVVDAFPGWGPTRRAPVGMYFSVHPRQGKLARL